MTEYPVYVSAWIAALCFFLSRFNCERIVIIRSHETWSTNLNRLGCIVLWIHIPLAYLISHDGSHSAAVDHVAERTQQMIGIRNGMGIYANFLVALVWSVQAFFRDSLQSRAAVPIEIFLWAMFIAASIPFAQRPTALAFSALVFLVALSHLLPTSPSARTGEHHDANSRS